MTADLADVGHLEPLIGSWRVEAEFPTLGVVHGWTTFDWLLGRRLDFRLTYRRTG
jgi:hypothetical protein